MLLISCKCNITACLAAAVLVAAGFASCSTGIDSTSKIKLSKKDLRSQEPTAEESLLSDVRPTYIKEWKQGKPFYVLDERVRVILTPANAEAASAPDTLIKRGSVLSYVGFETSQAPTGFYNTIIAFADGDRLYTYNTGRKSPDNLTAAPIRSDELPMMLDPEIMTGVKSKLTGLSLWILTRLWQNPSSDALTSGKKFAEVRVKDVVPGDKVFPLKVIFSEPDDTTSYAVFITTGPTGLSSRSFDSQFSLSDPRLKYPKIESEIWENIRTGHLATGMTKLECRLALGSPASSDEQPGYSSLYEKWTYPGGVVLNFTDGILTSFRQ